MAASEHQPDRQTLPGDRFAADLGELAGSAAASAYLQLDRLALNTSPAIGFLEHQADHPYHFLPADLLSRPVREVASRVMHSSEITGLLRENTAHWLRARSYDAGGLGPDAIITHADELDELAGRERDFILEAGQDAVRSIREETGVLPSSETEEMAISAFRNELRRLVEDDPERPIRLEAMERLSVEIAASDPHHIIEAVIARIRNQPNGEDMLANLHEIALIQQEYDHYSTLDELQLFKGIASSLKQRVLLPNGRAMPRQLIMRPYCHAAIHGFRVIQGAFIESMQPKSSDFDPHFSDQTAEAPYGAYQDYRATIYGSANFAMTHILKSFVKQLDRR